MTYLSKKTYTFSLLSLTIGLVSLPAQAAQIGTQVTTQTAVITGDDNQIFQSSNQVNASQLSSWLKEISQVGQIGTQITTQTATITGNNNQIFQLSNQVNAPQLSSWFRALDEQYGLKSPAGLAFGADGNLYVSDFEPIPVPEPDLMWGNLALSAFATGLLLKRQLRKR